MENVHRTHNARLRAHGEQLLQALEAQAAPETYTEILRAARALIAVKKALDLIHKDVAEDVAQSEAEVETQAAAPVAAASAQTAPVMNRQMRRTAEALARKVLKTEDRLRGSG